ncbi:MAG: methyltransferase domain-containing protein [Gammaproteobacteria bacterium]|nr:methyltransferase domain-containing protein [Gammaproteobacteria bacterium]
MARTGLSRYSAPMRKRFDEQYYERFYRNRRTRAATPKSAQRLAEFIAAYLRHLDVPVRRILDIGCGLGHTLRQLSGQFPNATAVGVEYSEYACQRYGFEQGSVVDYQAQRPFDLVVCNDVVPYLDDANAAIALRNLATLTKTALFFGVITSDDGEISDKVRTDSRQYLRSAGWYRRRLHREFVSVGGGLYLKKSVGIPLWALERHT